MVEVKVYYNNVDSYWFELVGIASWIVYVSLVVVVVVVVVVILAMHQW